MFDLRGTTWVAVIACLTACGPAPGDDADTPEDAATQPGDVETPAAGQITTAYLAGEWCAVEEGREMDGTTYVFATDGSYTFGREGSMSEGPGRDAFLQSIDVISIGPDELVASQMGRRLVMTRGACAPS